MLPYAVLTLVCAALATYSVTRLITSSLEERFDKQIVEAGRVTSDSVVRRERLHLSALRSVAFTEGVSDAVSTHNVLAVERLVRPVVSNAKAERVDVLDLNGQPLFATHLTDSHTLSYEDGSDADYTSWPIVQDVLQGRHDTVGDKWAEVVSTPSGSALYTAGPIVAPGGAVVGVVLVGSSLESVLAAAKSESLADVTVYDLDGQPLATTFALDAPERAALASAVAASSATAPREAKTLFGRGYQFLYGDLRIRDEVVGRYAVDLPTAGITSAGTTAQLQMSVIFGLVTILVLLTGWFLARHLTRPLMRLVAMARSVSDGDLSARSNVRSQDEIGALAVTFDSMADRLQRQHIATIGALASAIDARDPYTAGHSMRVGDLSSELGRELGLPGTALHHLRVGGILHDIGKIGVSDAVLLKPGALTPDERALIQQHPQVGLRILQGTELPQEVLDIVGGHHERLNGTGYPLGLCAEEIAPLPRIAAIADIYDALTTRRPYRDAMTPHEALKILRRESMEGLLDPEVVASMHRIVEHWEERRRSVETLTAAWAESLLHVKVA